MESPTSELVPASFDCVANTASEGQHIRLAFEPFGRKRVGASDPNHPNYQLIDAELHPVSIWSPTRSLLYFVDTEGDRYVLADGGAFRDRKWDHFEEYPEAGTLANHGRVLGKEAPDGDGYIPVGVHVVLLI